MWIFYSLALVSERYGLRIALLLRSASNLAKMKRKKRGCPN
jgi:hypothetical protein